VSPLVFRGADVDGAMAAAEARYRARGAAPMFQICDVNVPADLDQRLARRGYRLQEPCTCLAKRIGPASGAGIDARVEVAEAPGEAWLSVYLAGITLARRGLAPKILAGVPTPRAFLLFSDQGEPLATALCVLAEGVAIAECVATRADWRRMGAASRVMQALEAWGARRGARIAALQAVAANAPAQGLYAKLAYIRVGGYHYRVHDG
jgi:GNAT superfamily N-acetyltransferase